MSNQWRSALSQAMIEDLRVAIMAKDSHVSTSMFREMCDYIPPAAEARISRVNGRQRIEFPHGGQVAFVNHRNGIRGMSVDKLYVSIEKYRDLGDIAEAALATSRVGEVTYI